jgi:glycosyltransferase involved in cell wall biosynthesis
VSTWPLSRMDSDDPSLLRDDGSSGTNTRLANQASEVREARSDQAAARLRLIRAEDRAARFQWQLESIRASRSHRIIAILQRARQPRALLRLPIDILRVLTTPAPRPPRPLDASFRGRTEQTQAGWQAYDRRDYETAIAEANGILAVHPMDVPALELKQGAHWRRGDIAATLGALSRMRMVYDSPGLARRQRRYIGRAHELDPRWQPRVPGPPRPVEPREGVIMHLLKESVPYQVNGFTTRSRYTVQCQRGAGLDPFVVTSLGFPRKDGVTSFPPVEVVDGTPYHRLDPGPDYPLDQAHDVVLADTAWLAGRIGREQRPAVIHAGTGYRGFETALVGIALREHLRRPLVYEVRSFHETTWTDDIERAERGEHYEARRAAETRCMRDADLVVTIAEGMRGDIIARGIPAEKVFVVPNGVDADRFTPREPPAALRRKYGLEGKSVIGYVSNLDHPREGQEVLIEATARLRAGGRDVVCLLVGDGKRRGELEQLARSAAADGVIFVGQVPHERVRDFYSLMDVFVVPRVDERAARLVTPLKPFEAMAMRLPVVVSDLPALVGLAKPGQRGLAFAAGDPEALARTVETLLDNPDQAHRLAEEGRRWVIAERTWAANGRRYQDIYGELLDQWAARGNVAGGRT